MEGMGSGDDVLHFMPRPADRGSAGFRVNLAAAKTSRAPILRRFVDCSLLDGKTVTESVVGCRSIKAAPVRKFSIEKTATVVKIIRNLCIALAALAGGIWAIVRFKALDYPAYALAEAKSRIELNARSLQMSFDYKTRRYRNCLIYGEISAKNIGNSLITLSQGKEPPLLISEVVMYPSGHSVDKKTVRSFSD